MDIQQLNAIGKAIAQAVKSRFRFSDIQFYAGERIASGNTPWAVCFLSDRHFKYPPHVIPDKIIDRLLTLPDEQAMQELQLVIEAQARRLLGEYNDSGRDGKPEGKG
jgi:hypothetical protein